MKKLYLYTFLFFQGVTTTCFAQFSLYGPDAKIQFELQVLEKEKAGGHIDAYEGKHLYYRITHNNNEVIPYSPLGLTLDYADFHNELTIESKENYKVYKESYSIIHGKKKQIESNYSEQSFVISNAVDLQIHLQVRVYKSGVAFRYVLQDEYSTERTVLEEHTGFRIDTKGKAWIMPYSGPTKWKPAYELYYENGASIGDQSVQSPGWSFPSLFNIHENKYWVMLHEAGLTENYPGTHLGNNCKQGVYRIAFPHSGEALGRHSSLPKHTGKWVMPWRVIILSDQIKDLIESNIVYDLNPPNQLNGDLSWIKPGRASWEWWRKQLRERDFNLNKEYVDFADQMGWEYCLIDANWNEMKNGTINDLIDYAKSKNIGIFLWYNSGGSHNYVAEQPRGRLLNNRVRKEEFKRLQEWGVKGIKVDFFNTDKQFIMSQYLGILKDAAQYKLMVNFHGCTVPRGWSRTYPNLMTMEAAKGAETYGFGSEFKDKAPWHNVILAFTRNVIGPMDYTPVTFSNHNYPRKTTVSHELALAVVYQSAIIHFADEPKSYLEQPAEVIDFLKSVPVQFDEIRYLDGYPGEFIAVAKRKKRDWYIGVISGSDKEIKLDLKIDFLEQKYFDSSLEINDLNNKDDFIIRRIKNKVKDKIYSIKIKPYGGAILSFVSKKVD